MPATATQAVLDTPAAEFRLPATDGKTYALDDVAGEKEASSSSSATIVHVKAVIDRMVSGTTLADVEVVGL